MSKEITKEKLKKIVNVGMLVGFAGAFLSVSTMAVCGVVFNKGLDSNIMDTTIKAFLLSMLFCVFFIFLTAAIDMNDTKNNSQ